MSPGWPNQRWEDSHPDDLLCKCAEDEEKNDAANGYNLGDQNDSPWACGCFDCHGESRWWKARYYISEGFIPNETALNWVVGFLEEYSDAGEQRVQDFLAGVEVAQVDTLARADRLLEKANDAVRSGMEVTE